MFMGKDTMCMGVDTLICSYKALQNRHSSCRLKVQCLTSHLDLELLLHA